LPPGNLRQRVVNLLGQGSNKKLVPLREETDLVKMMVFVGKPEFAKKTRGDQFFFVNGRFIKSNYLNHSISKAFAEFIPENTYPFYCIFIDIDPSHVDINIHPTKTEVKFDDERTLYVLLQGIVKQGLGALHQAPDYDFGKDSIESEIYASRKPTTNLSNTPQIPTSNTNRKPNKEDWERLYKPEPQVRRQPEFDFPLQQVQKATAQIKMDLGKTGTSTTSEESGLLVQFRNRYILTERQNKMLIIDQHRAHQRILFEKFLDSQKGKQLSCQQLLFPQTIEFSAPDYAIICEADKALQKMGFELKEFGQNTLIVYGSPAGIPTGQIRDIFEQILADLKMLGTTKTQETLFEGVAKSVSARSAVTSLGKLSMIELKHLVEDLFRCKAPAYGPNGKPTFKTIDLEELSTFFS